LGQTIVTPHTCRVFRVRTSRARVGWGGYFDFSKQGGKHWLFEIEDDIASRQIDFNDLGFMVPVAKLCHYRATPKWNRAIRVGARRVETETRKRAQTDESPTRSDASQRRTNVSSESLAQVRIL
jgi:hypothetical protein